jgi:magnesium chelatase family protein
VVASVRSVALIGLDARPVRVECVVANGLPALRLVGLPDAAVRESGDRVRAAVRRAGFEWPQANVVVNLAPAAIPKVGSGFDLGIALAVLSASGQLPCERLEGTWAVGELGLDGTARATAGSLPAAGAARRAGARRFVVPDPGAVEARFVDGLEVVPVHDLDEAVAVLTGRRAARPPPTAATEPEAPLPDLRDVRGQQLARRSLEVAAAGAHHLLLCGPPGCGKSMLAQRLPGLLPALTTEEALEVAAIHSVAGARRPEEPLSRRPPFRAPHHTTSAAGLVGGGSGVARPGELSLAHRGILFMDELLETPRWVLDALRQPLERGSVTVVRSRATVRYPARVLLVAATNPCPCGYLGDPRRPCRCRPDQIDRYRARLSGPLLDRIDLQVTLHPVDPGRFLDEPDGEDSATVAARVAAARARSAARWGSARQVRDVHDDELRRSIPGSVLRRAVRAVETLGLSARGFGAILRVARTIADLDDEDEVGADHVDEAAAYRLPDPLGST